MNAEQAWQAVLGQLQMEMPRASFDTWVRDTRFIGWEDGVSPLAREIIMPATGWKTAFCPPSRVCHGNGFL